MKFRHVGLPFACAISMQVYATPDSSLQIPTPPDSAATESRCGASLDYQEVEQYDGTLGPSVGLVSFHQEAVGQLQWNNNLAGIYDNAGNVSNRRWCTGTLIARNLFLTAGHCFDVHENDGSKWDFPIDNATGSEITPQQAATNMHVNFDFQEDPDGNLRTEIAVAVTAMLEYRIDGLDFAILQLAGNPGDDFGYTQISNVIPEVSDLMTIIQHPRGIPKVVEAGSYSGLLASGYFGYVDLDTEGGSSGSGVLNSKGQVIGVHTNGGCSVDGGENRGVLINNIAASSPILTNILDNRFSWSWLDNNSRTEKIIADDHTLYQMHNNGSIWRFEGTPYSGWSLLDTNSRTVDIVADGGNLYQLHSNGQIWRYTGTPFTGWQRLDANPATVKIIADGDNLYQLHSTGRIWRYTGTPYSGWELLDRNSATVDIVASGGHLYQRHNNGRIWRYTGTPISGWQQLDGNPATTNIVADGNELYQLHNNGMLWRYTGTPFTGWQQIDGNPSTVEITASNGNLYQRHSNGMIWEYTGTPFSGWRWLDGNPATSFIVADQDNLYQLHDTGVIWTYAPEQ